MKIKFLILLFFVSIKIWGCKCADSDLKKSFEDSEFVFIGEIYDVVSVPSGYKTLDDFLSKVKIEKIYKDNSFAEFYKDKATIFASQLRSCDYIFDRKGKYLIFANYEPDTGFLYSSQCFYIKPFTEVSKDGWKLLNILSSNVRNSEPKKVDEENIDVIVDDLFNQPNRKIMNLQLENKRLYKSNTTYIIFTVISTSLLTLILFVGIYRKIKK